MRQVVFTIALAAALGAAGLLPEAGIVQAAHATSEQKQQYTCPMHPQVKSNHPGQCPICHMDLVPVKTKGGSKEGKKVKYYRHPMDPSIHSKVPAKDSMGMDYIPVYEDEASRGATDSKVEGRAAFALSPEQLRLSGTSVVPVERRTLKRELRVPGRALGGSGVSFQVFEQDLALIKPGMSFEVEAPMIPGERFEGQVTSIESILDPMTRTARVNGVVRGATAAALRSEASLSGALKVSLPGVLAVPEAAIVHTGTKHLVFIATEHAGFAPREIKLGARAQGFYEVKEGVREGERISAGPNFLLDSESRIQFSYDLPE